MNIRAKDVDLHLKYTFTISRGSEDVAEVVITELEHEGIVGYGEASPSARHHESRTTVREFLRKVQLGRWESPFLLEEIDRSLDSITQWSGAARASVDIALHDWVGKSLGMPLWKLWGLDRRKTPRTSYTVGLDRLDVMERKVREAEEFPILKVKVGVPEDREIIRTIRNVTDKPVRVDANEGWRTKEVALEKIKWLEGEGIEFVEQPMPAQDLASCAWLRERVNLPIIADENCVRLQDIPKLKDAFDGINIKLMKCGGLREALRMIHTAKAFGMKIMLGCMIESSVAISAAAHLSPLVDYADLDGHILITDDPFVGVKVVDGKLELNDSPGLGVVPRTESSRLTSQLVDRRC